MDQADLHDLLFLVDRGFYSEENLALFTAGGSNYIILSCNLLVDSGIQGLTTDMLCPDTHPAQSTD